MLVVWTCHKIQHTNLSLKMYKYIIKVCFSTADDQHPLKSAEDTIKELLETQHVLIKPTINIAELDVDNLLNIKEEAKIKTEIKRVFNTIYPETEIVHIKIERAQ